MIANTLNPKSFMEMPVMTKSCEWLMVSKVLGRALVLFFSPPREPWNPTFSWQCLFSWATHFPLDFQPKHFHRYLQTEEARWPSWQMVTLSFCHQSQANQEAGSILLQGMIGSCFFSHFKTKHFNLRWIKCSRLETGGFLFPVKTKPNLTKSNQAKPNLTKTTPPKKIKDKTR